MAAALLPLVHTPSVVDQTMADTPWEDHLVLVLDHPEEDHRMNPTTTMINQASPTTRQRQHLRDELCDTSSASYAHANGHQ